MKRLFLLLALLIILAGCQAEKPTPHPRPTDPANANPGDVSLNGLALPGPAKQPYRILVVGHLYGGINGSDRLPDQALLKKLPEIKTSGISMLVSLGDMVRTSKKEDFDELDRLLLRQLPFPAFNIPGNHDVENRALYEARYGQTYYSFNYGPSRLIFLDAERQECAIDSEQVDFLLSAIRSARSDASIKNILIFMHKTLFFNNERLFELKKKNAQPNDWKCFNSHGFNEIEKNILEPTATKKPIYLFAGDVGAWGNLTPYYEKRSDLPITRVMTGLGDSPNDSGILITVHGDKVDLEIYPLTKNAMPPLETFTPDYWIRQASGQ